MGFASVVVEADGGSRGNPGNAAYGAVLKDAATGDVIAERGMRIGVASNNVAEYRGLIAGLELYREYAEGADVEVRMDSKLVVEQMSGRWKIKHPSMRPLALEASRLAPPGTRYTWVPRAQNSHADRLANLALDGPEGVVVGGHRPAGADPLAVAEARASVEGAPTTLVLVSHGEVDDTPEDLFGGGGDDDPGLSSEGREQIEALAAWLAPLAEESPVLLSSPARAARESAEILSGRLGTAYSVHEGFPGQPNPEQPDAEHADRTVVVVADPRLIQGETRSALGLLEGSGPRAEVSPGSVTVLVRDRDGRSVVRMLNGQPRFPLPQPATAPRNPRTAG